MPPRPTRPARADKGMSQSIGRAAPKSREQAQRNAARADAQEPDLAPVLTPDGRPMVMIEMSAAELIPTGQFANVSVGPARMRAWIDPRNPEPFSDEEKENMAKALNTIAELVEVDVIGVQRALVLESIQQNLSGDNR